MKKFIFCALAATGEGISGSDRIFIEFARHWGEKFPVDIHLWDEGFRMCQRQNLTGPRIKYHIANMQPWQKFGLVINYLSRIVKGIKIGSTLKIDNPEEVFIYSASEFWMDSLPALILKMRYFKIKWVAAWYQSAPKPWQGFAEGKREQRYFLRALAYWFVQLPIRPLIARYADYVLVNNNEEKKVFADLNKQGKVRVVLGAVDLKNINKWRKRFEKLPKIYDVVFQGRFHPQKGVLELVEIWKMVTDQRSNAKLIMIGDGPLMNDIKSKIKNLGLGKNIILTGFLFDGEEKYRIFSQSKIVAHPSFYDSGGMAAAEAMAFGLPAVGFDLISYKSYYPKGMVKVPINDLQSFTKAILNFLDDTKLYTKIGKEAYEIITKNWSWELRANGILDSLE